MKFGMGWLCSWLYGVHAQKGPEKAQKDTNPCQPLYLYETPVEGHSRAFQGGAIIRHFKRQWDTSKLGHLYIYIGEGVHTETGQSLVLYAPVGSKHIYCRPEYLFYGMVDKVKYPDAIQKFRFELATSDEILLVRTEGMYNYGMR